VELADFVGQLARKVSALEKIQAELADFVGQLATGQPARGGVR
jgi:hypothetical protein